MSGHSLAVVVPRHALSVERARDMLSAAVTSDEVKGIRDVATAMQAYARTQKAGHAIAVDAGEIILRADRRMGELSRELPKTDISKNAKKNEVRTADLVSKSSALADLGATKQRASEWEQIATLPADDFDAYVGAARKAECVPTTSGAVALAKLPEAERKKVLAALGDNPDVKKAIRTVRRSTEVPPTEEWDEGDEIHRASLVVREVIANWKTKSLLRLKSELVLLMKLLEKEHARRQP